MMKGTSSDYGAFEHVSQQSPSEVTTVCVCVSNTCLCRVCEGSIDICMWTCVWVCVMYIQYLIPSTCLCVYIQCMCVGFGGEHTCRYMHVDMCEGIHAVFPETVPPSLMLDSSDKHQRKSGV